jgi:predicted O-methyltransferase YrrM
MTRTIRMLDVVWPSQKNLLDGANGAAPGWFNHGAEILRLVDQHQPKVCVELGTWLGASAIPVARSVRRWGGTLTCIDTWAGEVGCSGALETPPWMLLSCARNVMVAGVSGSVRFLPSTTEEAARWWTEPIDYLYIDADHSFPFVWADLLAWVPKVRPGGLVLGDDYGNEMFPDVQRAWDDYERHYDLSFTRYQSDPPDPYGTQLIYGTV